MQASQSTSPLQFYDYSLTRRPRVPFRHELAVAFPVQGIRGQRFHSHGRDRNRGNPQSVASLDQPPDLVMFYQRAQSPGNNHSTRRNRKLVARLP